MSRARDQFFDIAETAPLRLADAIKIAFPQGGMTVSGLRREAARGRLAIMRIAGKDWTTLASIREMMEKCLAHPKEPTSGCVHLAAANPAPSRTPDGSKDRGRQFSTGCGAGDRAEAERKLSQYIASKYAPARRERDLSEIPVSDVINIYLTDVVPGQARESGRTRWPVTRLFRNDDA
jgi:hypothetical protein